jgi:hypothetical protein
MSDVRFGDLGLVRLWTSMRERAKTLKFVRGSFRTLPLYIYILNKYTILIFRVLLS